MTLVRRLTKKSVTRLWMVLNRQRAEQFVVEQYDLMFALIRSTGRFAPDAIVDIKAHPRAFVRREMQA